MKRNLLLFSCLWLFEITFAQNAMIIGDCTVTYKISGGDAATNSNLSNATKIFYVKGRMARTDMIGSNYKQSVIYDNSKGDAVILKEIGDEKYMTTLSADEWKNQNNYFEGQTVTLDNDTKTILGYECKKVMARLKDGTSYNMYYTSTITPSASENPFQFKAVPGFVLEYETVGNNRSSKITYTAVQINFDPVPASRFKVPASGYRIIK
jgi:GLPGLI family protein